MVLPWPDEHGRWGGLLACLSGPFQDNVQSMVDVLGKPVSLPGDNLQAWGIAIDHPDGKRYTPRALKSLQTEAPATCWIHVYRETVADPADGACDQCRIMGWNAHPMCRTTWHVILPAPEDMAPQPDTLHDDSASVVVYMVQHALCGGDVPALQAHDIAVGCLDSSRHLLHGMLHGNGYGHLLRLNGRDAAAAGEPRPASRTPHGPGTASRRRLRSTASLQTQPLLTTPTMGMDLRVLLPAATGATFYGGWGFHFGRAGYGQRQEDWDAAVATLAATSLSDMQTACRNEFTTSAVLHRYAQAAQAHAVAGEASLRDLLSVMLAASYDEAMAVDVLQGAALHPGTIKHGPKTDTSTSASASSSLLKGVAAQFAAVKGSCAPRLLTAAPSSRVQHTGNLRPSTTTTTPPKAKHAANHGPRSEKRSAPQANGHVHPATKRPRRDDSSNGTHAATMSKAVEVGGRGVGRRGQGGTGGQSRRPQTKPAGKPRNQQTQPITKTPPSNTKHTPHNNITTKPSPLARELRSLLRDLGDAQGLTPTQGPRRVVRPTFFNPSLQQPVVVLATGRRGDRTPGHGGEGSCAHASLGHLGLVGATSPLIATGSNGPLPGAPWSPLTTHGACAQVRIDLKHVWGTVLAPPRRKGAAAWQAALQVLCDTKHFVKDYGGTTLPAWVESKNSASSVARVLLYMQLHGTVLPPFLITEESAGDVEKDVQAAQDGRAASASSGVRKQRKKHKWTRHKGAHRKPTLLVEHISNDAASAHPSGGFPPKLLAAAARDAAVEHGLRMRLCTTVPPLVLCTPRSTRVGALLTTARRVLASMYPLLDGTLLLSLAVPQAGPAAGANKKPSRGSSEGTSKNKKRSVKKAATSIALATDKDPMPLEAVSGRGLLLDGTLHAEPWSPTWRFAGGGVAWVVACSCGIFDDDGNHMVLCDTCGFWMHSRCEGLAEEGAPPPRFVCMRCRQQQKPAQ